MAFASFAKRADLAQTGRQTADVSNKIFLFSLICFKQAGRLQFLSNKQSSAVCSCLVEEKKKPTEFVCPFVGLELEEFPAGQK